MFFGKWFDMLKRQAMLISMASHSPEFMTSWPKGLVTLSLYLIEQLTSYLNSSSSQAISRYPYFTSSLTDPVLCSYSKVTGSPVRSRHEITSFFVRIYYDDQ